MKIGKAAAFVAAVAIGSMIGAMIQPGRTAPVLAEQSPDSVRYAMLLGQAYMKAADAVSPAVVHVASSRQVSGLGEDIFGRFFELPRDALALGSGVILSSEGHILTNFHVIKGADKLRVKLHDGRIFNAAVVGTDPPTDLAVIRIDSSGLPVMPMGDSDQIAVGHLVLAVGNPYGLDRTITQGIISAKGRANVGIADYEDFIQTDAAINPGNSGGPLVDISGKMIGINTAIFTRTGGFQGIGFAIPSNMAKRVLDELVSQGRVKRGYLGLTVQNITPDIAKAFNITVDRGVVVTDVMEGSPAQAAGFQKGDVITRYDDRPVSDVRELRSMVATTAIGSSVGISMVRGAQKRRLVATITEQKTQEQAAPPARLHGTANERLGLEAHDLTDEVRRQHGIKAQQGVLVTGVVSGGPADKAGVKAGSVILEVNHKSVTGTKQFQRMVAQVPENDNVLLLVLDGVMKYYVVIRPGR